MPRDASRSKGTLRKRGDVYFARFWVDGQRVERSTGTGDRVCAKARLRELVAGNGAPRKPPTVAEYAATWIPERVAAIRSGADEERWLRLHALPALGHHVLEDLSGEDVAAWVRGLRAAGLAARSIRNAHGALLAMLARACFTKVIPSNPAKDLPRGTLPKIGRSSHPAFTLPHVAVLLTDERIEHPRRVVYAIAALTGCRGGEAAGRRWRDLEDREPLRGLRIATQWNDAPLKGARDEHTAERLAPVHAELEAVLAGWRSAWSEYFGRLPRPDDWIVPGDAGATVPMTRNQLSKALMRDLQRVELDVGKGAGLHSFRRFFVTTARRAGFDRDTIAEITHAPVGDVVEASYTRRAWETLCEVVASIAYRRDAEAEVVQLPRVASAGGASGGADPSETPQKGWRRRESKPSRDAESSVTASKCGCALRARSAPFPRRIGHRNAHGSACHRQQSDSSLRLSGSWPFALVRRCFVPPSRMTSTGTSVSLVCTTYECRPDSMSATAV